MEISTDQVALVRYVVAEFVRRRQLCGQPVPERVRRLLAEVSAHGTSRRDAQPHSKPETDDLIDTAQAAQIIGVSTRRIRGIAADLDGQQIAGRWVFARRAVTEYAEAKGT
ncbi:hypothetical protein MYK68_04085 [Gordonia sp. PP30]|uniref:hypothetical protein n=1 Tax=Gordonia sp. PP30 TaxID=2935861 RepID=UPI001FFF76F4|nr:hypothetical protein [Gordonia sp. PP30]UQE75799.1 hypothetical protein MYK68_04085 [Gordonia sp. PP30]